MIRLILVAIGVFIVWVLFLSEFRKRQKIVICALALLICIVGVWFEQSSQTPKNNIMLISELVDCGVTANHSYRTNYDVEFCLRNTSDTATAKRIAMSFIALTCVEGTCEEVQSISKEVSLDLGPQNEIRLTENINFNQVNSSLNSIVWVAQVNSVKALD